MNTIHQNDCVIKRVIVHILNNSISEPELTEEEVVLPDEYKSFLQSHISTSLKGSIPCIFDNKTANSVVTNTGLIVSDPDLNFVSKSQELTKSLFALMKKQTINNGTLWVVLFSKDGDAETYLALLKMDDKASLSWKTEVNAEGKRTIRLEGNSKTLPQEEVRLDKAAFIFSPCFPGSKHVFEYELRVVDRKLSGHMIADFFSKFLGCSAAFQAKRNTRRFIDTVDRFAQEKTTELEKENLLQDIQIMKSTFIKNHDEILNEDFVNAVFGNKLPDLKSDLHNMLCKSIQSESFNVDPDIKNKMNKKTVWKLNHGTSRLELRGEPDAFKEMVNTEHFHTDKIITIRLSDFSAM